MPKAEDHPIAVRWLGRVGYAAKGIIFITLGLLAVNAALAARTTGDLPVNQGRALSEIERKPLGWVLVAGLCAGLLCFALWHAFRVILNLEDHKRDAKGILMRGWYSWVAIFNLVLAASAASLATGLAGKGLIPWRSNQAQDELVDQVISALSTDIARDALMVMGAMAVIFGLARTAQGISLHINTKRRWWWRARRAFLFGQAAAAGSLGIALVLAGHFNSVQDLRHYYSVYQQMLHGHYGRPAMSVAAIILLATGIYDLIYIARA